MKKKVSTKKTNIERDVSTKETNIVNNVSTEKVTEEGYVSTSFVPTYEKKLNFKKDSKNTLTITIPSNVNGGVDYTALDNLQLEVKRYVRQNHLKVYLKLISLLGVSYRAELEEIMSISKRDIEEIYSECESKGYTIRASISDSLLNEKKELLLLAKVPIGKVKFIKLHPNLHQNSDLINFKLEEGIKRDLNNRSEFLNSLRNELRQREREQYEKKKKKAEKELPVYTRVENHIKKSEQLQGIQITKTSLKKLVYVITNDLLGKSKLEFVWDILKERKYIIRIELGDNTNYQYVLNNPENNNETENNTTNGFEKEANNYFKDIGLK